MEEKKLEGFYSEEVLAEMLYHGEISRLSYVWHSTEQMRQENLAKSAKLQEIGWREYLEQKG